MQIIKSSWRYCCAVQQNKQQNQRCRQTYYYSRQCLLSILHSTLLTRQSDSWWPSYVMMPSTILRNGTSNRVKTSSNDDISLGDSRQLAASVEKQEKRYLYWAIYRCWRTGRKRESPQSYLACHVIQEAAGLQPALSYQVSAPDYGFTRIGPS